MRKENFKSVALQPTISPNISVEEMQEFFYQKNKLAVANITTVLTQNTQDVIRKRITKENLIKFNPQDFDRFITMDGQNSDFHFIEKFKLGQKVVVRDFSWPNSGSNHLLDAIVIDQLTDEIVSVSPYTFDYELASNNSTILEPSETGLQQSIAILNEFKVPVFNYQLEKNKDTISDIGYEKIMHTLIGEDKLLTFTGSQIKSKFDWRFPSRQFIKEASKRLSLEANNSLLHLDQATNLKFLEKVDTILTFDTDLLNNYEKATNELDKVLELAA